VGSDQEKTFGPTISRLIHDNIEPERLCLWDSKKRGGRPDIVNLVKDTYHTWGAEVVFITSNYQGNGELMEGCKKLGIPAFVSAFPRYACWSVLIIIVRAPFGTFEPRETLFSMDVGAIAGYAL
jgi:hypothetical protein